jgi:hypothetical protein
MKTNRSTVAAVLAVTLSMGSICVAADSDPKVEVVKNACPGEGCRFGDSVVQHETVVRSEANAQASQVGTLMPGESVVAVTGEIHMVPGIAKVIGRLPKGGEALDPKLPLEILDYIGEGYSRTKQGSNTFHVKVARSKAECPERGPRYCWVEILREPSKGDWWVMVKAKGRELSGWVDMGAGGIAMHGEGH